MEFKYIGKKVIITRKPLLLVNQICDDCGNRFSDKNWAKDIKGNYICPKCLSINIRYFK